MKWELIIRTKFAIPNCGTTLYVFFSDGTNVGHLGKHRNIMEHMGKCWKKHWKHVKKPIWDVFLERVENLGNYDVLGKSGKQYETVLRKHGKTMENIGKNWIKNLKLPSLLECKKKIVNVYSGFVFAVFQMGKKLQTVRCLVGDLRVVKDFLNCRACLGVETCRFGACVSCKHAHMLHIWYIYLHLGDF